MSRNRKVSTKSKRTHVLNPEDRLRAFIVRTYKDRVDTLRLSLCPICRWQNKECNTKKLVPVTTKGEDCPYFQKGDA